MFTLFKKFDCLKNKYIFYYMFIKITNWLGRAKQLTINVGCVALRLRSAFVFQNKLIMIYVALNFPDNLRRCFPRFHNHCHTLDCGNAECCPITTMLNI